MRSTWFRVGVLSLARPPWPATYGTAHPLTGIVRGYARAALETRSGGGAWQRAAEVQPSKEGLVATSVRPRLTSYYRLRAARVFGATIRVPVAPLVRFYPVEGPGVLRGRVRPVMPAASIEIQRLAANTWATVARAVVDSGGDFEARVTLRSGTYRALVPPARGLVAGTTPPLRVVAP